ncbi:unnamed protein product [Pedinophyceae sp. YPF-701]|nr:unnamed protein product [Pedinophyceae sp. YPF-701]
MVSGASSMIENRAAHRRVRLMGAGGAATPRDAGAGMSTSLLRPGAGANAARPDANASPSSATPRVRPTLINGAPPAWEVGRFPAGVQPRTARPLQRPDERNQPGSTPICQISESPRGNALEQRSTAGAAPQRGGGDDAIPGPISDAQPQEDLDARLALVRQRISHIQSIRRSQVQAFLRQQGVARQHAAHGDAPAESPAAVLAADLASDLRRDLERPNFPAPAGWRPGAGSDDDDPVDAHSAPAPRNAPGVTRSGAARAPPPYRPRPPWRGRRRRRRGAAAPPWRDVDGAVRCRAQQRPGRRAGGGAGRGDRGVRRANSLNAAAATPGRRPRGDGYDGASLQSVLSTPPRRQREQREQQQGGEPVYRARVEGPAALIREVRAMRGEYGPGPSRLYDAAFAAEAAAMEAAGGVWEGRARGGVAGWVDVGADAGSSAAEAVRDPGRRGRPVGDGFGGEGLGEVLAGARRRSGGRGAGEPQELSEEARRRFVGRAIRGRSVPDVSDWGGGLGEILAPAHTSAAAPEPAARPARSQRRLAARAEAAGAAAHPAPRQPRRNAGAVRRAPEEQSQYIAELISAAESALAAGRRASWVDPLAGADDIPVAAEEPVPGPDDPFWDPVPRRRSPLAPAMVRKLLAFKYTPEAFKSHTKREPVPDPPARPNGARIRRPHVKGARGKPALPPEARGARPPRPDRREDTPPIWRSSSRGEGSGAEGTSRASGAGTSAGESCADPECAICLVEFEEGQALRLFKGCRHVFHEECVSEWFKTGDFRCPMCRWDPAAQGWDSREV